MWLAIVTVLAALVSAQASRASSNEEEFECLGDRYRIEKISFLSHRVQYLSRNALSWRTWCDGMGKIETKNRHSCTWHGEKIYYVLPPDITEVKGYQITYSDIFQNGNFFDMLSGIVSWDAARNAWVELEKTDRVRASLEELQTKKFRGEVRVKKDVTTTIDFDSHRMELSWKIISVEIYDKFSREDKNWRDIIEGPYADDQYELECD